MTKQEFLDALTQVPLTWTIDGAKLRGAPHDTSALSFCPLTAVCWQTTGQLYALGEAGAAADVLGIRADLDGGNLVVDLADHVGTTCPHCAPDYAFYQAMLAACNVPEPPYSGNPHDSEEEEHA